MIKIILALFFLPSTIFAQDSSCQLDSTAIMSNLKLTWKEFDQTPEKGHRKYQPKCVLEAAKLIDIYTIHHMDNLNSSQVRALIWHAGQAYATENLNSIAVVRMLKAINPHEEKPPQSLNWNDYVHATVAFLQKKKSYFSIDLKWKKALITLEIS